MTNPATDPPNTGDLLTSTAAGDPATSAPTTADPAHGNPPTEPLSANEPSTTGDPNSAGEPNSEAGANGAGGAISTGEQPGAAEAATGESTSPDEPNSSGEPSTAGEPNSSGEPSTAGEPNSSGEPSTAGEPNSSGEPSTAGEPNSSGEPSTAGEPNSSGEPSTAGEPNSAGEPAIPGGPHSTNEPPATGEPTGAGGPNGAGGPHGVGAGAADEVRWRGHTHEELYLMLHDGPGAAASAVPSRRWAALAATLTEVGADLYAALGRAGDSWTGRAAAGAYDQLSRPAAWAATSAESAAAMREAVETQADHVARARAEMPAPANVPSQQPDPAAAVVGVVGTATDLEPVEAAASAGEQRAFEVMAAYELSSTLTAGSLAGFDAPGHVAAHAAHRGPTPSPALTAIASALLGLVPALAKPDGQHTAQSRAKPKPRPHRPAPPPGTPTSAKPLDVPVLGVPRGKAGRTQTRRSGTTGSAPARPATTTPVPAAEAHPAAPVAVNSTGTAQPAHGAGTAASATPSGPHDKLALRRFGTESIGSSQWFGDQPQQAVGDRPRRRAELRSTEQVVESVAILDREHRLAPTVIGDGKTR